MHLPFRLQAKLAEAEAAVQQGQAQHAAAQVQLRELQVGMQFYYYLLYERHCLVCFRRHICSFEPCVRCVVPGMLLAPNISRRHCYGQQLSQHFLLSAAVSHMFVASRHNVFFTIRQAGRQAGVF